MDLEPVGRIALAALMSLPIGLDRELHGKPAGLRTHVLLATATAALGYLSVDLAEGDVSADPTRIASYVVAGVGFLGAGLIVGVRGRVYGLTTAAAAFSVMTIGLLNGTGYVLVATALTILSLLALGPIEWLKPRTYGKVSQVETTMHVAVVDATQLAHLLTMPGENEVEVRGVEVVPAGDVVLLQLTVRAKQRQLTALCQQLADDASTAGAPTVSGASSGDSD